MNRDALHAPHLDPCSGADHHRYGFELPARVEYVSRARRLTRDRLHCWGIRGDVHDTAMLVISELVTNAVVHSGSHLVSCELLNDMDRLRISVQDQGCAPTGPHVCHSRAAEERGRGLLLVEAVASAWGAHATQHGAGRIVWAELAHAQVPYGADFPESEPVRDPAREQAAEPVHREQVPEQVREPAREQLRDAVREPGREAGRDFTRAQARPHRPQKREARRPDLAHADLAHSDLLRNDLAHGDLAHGGFARAELAQAEPGPLRAEALRPEPPRGTERPC